MTAPAAEKGTGSATPTEQEPFLERLVASVFPDGTRLVEHDHADAARYYLIGNADGPRWLLPGDPRIGCRFFMGGRHLGRGARFRWGSLRLAYRLELLEWIPGIVRVGQDMRLLGGRSRVEPIGLAVPRMAPWTHLGWRRPAAPVPVVHIGWQGPTQKLVAGLVAREEECVHAVAKIALGEKAAALVRREAEMLSLLARERPDLGPALRHLDPTRGVAVLSPVAGRTTGRRLTGAHWRFLMALRQAGATMSLGEEAAALAARLYASRPEALDDDACIVARTLAQLERAGEFPAFWIHGDVAPWNLRRRKDGRIVAFDWEHGSAGGPPLQDLIYFIYSQAFCIDGRSGLDAVRRNTSILHAFLDELGVTRRALDMLLRYHLAANWLREHRHGNQSYAQALAADLRALAADD